MSAPAPAVPSYASGTSDVPLLGDTIGDDLDRTVAAQPDAEALVEVPTGRRWTYRELRDDVEIVAMGLLAAGPAEGRPGRHLGAERGRVDARAVRDREDRRHPGQHQPGVPHARAGSTCSSRPASRLLVAATRFKTSDYAAMIEEVRPDCPGLRQVVLIGTARLGRARGGGRAGRPRRAGPAAGRAEPGRPDQHPVHVGHHRLPEGRHALAPQHPQQRLLRRRGCAATPRRTACASRCPSTTASAWSWATSACTYQRRHDGHPRRRLRPEGHAARRRARSGARRSTACRRCSSPSSTTRTSTPTTCPRCAPGSWPARRARSR